MTIIDEVRATLKEMASDCRERCWFGQKYPDLHLPNGYDCESCERHDDEIVRTY